jgi:CBS domain-containing protein
VLFLFWDEGGGTPAGDDPPFLAISPMAKPGYVSNVDYDTNSYLSIASSCGQVAHGLPRAVARALLLVDGEEAAMSIHERVPQCTVYGGRGTPDLPAMELRPLECELLGSEPVSDRAALRTIMTRDLVCARPDLEIASVVRLMMQHSIGCIPVVDEHRHPIGIITKLDLVEQLDAAMRCAAGDCPLPTDLVARTADDVMMPLALTLDEHATVAHAAAKMISEDVHHVLVTDRDGLLVGIVSAQDIVRWVEQQRPETLLRAARRGPPVWHPRAG